MKELFIATGSEFFSIQNSDNIEICRIYFDGFNGSELTKQQAAAYAALFQKSRQLLEDVAEAISELRPLFR